MTLLIAFVVTFAAGAVFATIFHSRLWSEYLLLHEFVAKLKTRAEELPGDIRNELIELLEGKR